MKIAELIAGLRDAIAKSGGKPEIFNGMVAVRNGITPVGQPVEHYAMFSCYIRHHCGITETGDMVDYHLRRLWGNNYMDFWYALRHPAGNCTTRQKWIKRLIRQSLGLLPRRRLTSD